MDATVPNWRYAIEGAQAIRAELGRWYADPGRFEELRRTPLVDGELVEFTLSWEEGGIPHAAHQVHIIGLDPSPNGDAREGSTEGMRRAPGIISDRVWCGGRWPAELLAEMGRANTSDQTRG